MSSLRCDGIGDCPDNSDEFNCPAIVRGDHRNSDRRQRHARHQSKQLSPKLLNKRSHFSKIGWFLQILQHSSVAPSPFTHPHQHTLSHTHIHTHTDRITVSCIAFIHAKHRSPLTIHFLSLYVQRAAISFMSIDTIESLREAYPGDFPPQLLALCLK